MNAPFANVPNPEIVALITLCGLRRQAADRALVERHLRRWAPDSAGGTLAGPMDRAATALARYSQCWVEGLIGNPEEIARAETLALTALVTRQRGIVDIHDQAIDMLAVPGWRKELATPLADLADALAAAGCTLPLVMSCAVGVRRQTIDPQRVADVQAASQAMQDLEAGERVVAEGLRYAAHAVAQGREAIPELETALRHNGYFDCAPALMAVIRIIANAARRPVAIHQRCCPQISADEGRLVQIVALMQRQDERGSGRHLGALLPEAAARMALHPLKGLALGLLGGNTVLPLRDWRFREIADLPQIWGPDHRAVATLQ